MQKWLIEKGLTIVANPLVRSVVYTTTVIVVASEVNKGLQAVKKKVHDRFFADDSRVDAHATPVE